MRCILRNDLKFHPYKMQIIHQLSPQDAPNRLAFCREFVRLSNKRSDLLNNLIISDEAHFHLSNTLINRALDIGAQIIYAVA